MSPPRGGSRRRVAIGLEYDGNAYCGWQSQARSPTIQAQLEAALSRVADEAVQTVCAGRTDAGVHARGQVVHFDTRARRRERAWALGANSYLPRDISVQWAQTVPGHFHARYSALARTYRYLVLNRPTRSALAAGRALCVHRPLDLQAMREAAHWLIGEHDFSAFRSVECQSRSPVRRLETLELEREADLVRIEVTANAFLHHMARNLVGVLLTVGLGQAPPGRARDLLHSGQRSAAGPTVAAGGLYLWKVRYPRQFGLPDDSAMMSRAVTVS